MATELEIQVPTEVPVMTLPNVAFFPQALLPLQIFESRYCKMLRDVLAADRIFAIAGLDQRPAAQAEGSDPPHRIAGVGIVRACQKNTNGTSSLLLQGLCRVEITGIVTDKPYRRIGIRPLVSKPGAPAMENQKLRAELSRLLGIKLRLSATSPGEMTAFLKTIDDPETFVDIAAYSLCESPALKQRLLETLDVHRRLELFSRGLRTEIKALRLRKRLQGRMPDQRIGDN